MTTPDDIINRTSDILTHLPFTQSPEGFRAFLIAAGLTSSLGQIDFYGKAPNTFWINLVWDLWNAGNTNGIESLLYTAKERVGIDLKERLDDITKDFKTLLGVQKGTIYKGDLWYFLPKGMEDIVEKIRESTRYYLLSFISEYSQDYIEHSLDHSDRTIAIINNWLLDEEQKSYLQENEWMVFFLYASAYLHDIGLCSSPNTISFLPDVNNRKKLLETYGERSAIVIRNKWREFGIENAFQADVLAKICTGLHLPINAQQLQLRIPYLQTGKNINIQFLASCLKLVNELDFTPGRIPFLIEKFSSNVSLVSEENSYNFGGIGPHNSYIDTICTYIQCREIDVHRAFKGHEGFVQTLLNEINRNINPRFKFTHVIYEIENIGYEPIDFKFRVEASAALEVFMGTPIYTQKATFLRELVQNSIDACGVRSIYDPAYSPKISVIKAPDNKTVIVKDNGIGMDKTWVEKYFLTVGISFYRSEEFENINALDMGFAPISRFGIGILSCFMVADRIVIRTKKLNSIGLEIDISDFRNYFSVKFDESIEQGTVITIILKPEFYGIDCLGFLLDTIKCAKYPIEYQYFNGEKRIIANYPVSLVSKLKLEFWANTWKRYEEDKISLLSSEAYIAFEKKTPSSLMPSNLSECKVYIHQDGIYICNEPQLLPKWILSNIIITANLIKDDRLDLSISRIGIIQNKKYELLKERIEIALVSLLRRIFKQLESENPSRNIYQNLVKSFIAKCISITTDKAPLSLLGDFYCFTLFISEDNVLGYYYFRELMSLGKIVIFRREIDFTSDNIKKYESGKTYFITSKDAYLLILLDTDKKFEIF